MRVDNHLDWVSITFPEDVSPRSIFRDLSWTRTGKGRHGYRSRYENADTGAVVQTHATDPAMGTHLTLSGGTLSILRQNGWKDDALMKHFKTIQGRASRLDCAMNMHGTVLTPQMFKEAADLGKLTAKARQFLFVQGAHDGDVADTFYIGNRSSERFMRVYDKNAERRIKDAEAHLRLELELKNVRARAIQNAMVQHSPDTVIRAAFVDFVQYDAPEFQEALTGPTAEIQELGRQQTNTEAWLLDQVTVALAHVTALNPGFMATFMERFFKEKRVLGEKEDYLERLELFDREQGIRNRDAEQGNTPVQDVDRAKRELDEKRKKTGKKSVNATDFMWSEYEKGKKEKRP